MRVLVTGANGFMGSHLCEVLLEQGHEVRAMVRRTSNLRWIEHLQEASGVERAAFDTPHPDPLPQGARESASGGFELVYGDLRDGDSLTTAVQGVEWLFHAGAELRARDRAEFERVNYEGTLKLVQAAIDAGVKKLVFFSTVAAAGPAQSAEEPLTEEGKPEPVSAYGRAKLRAEGALQERRENLNSVILRFPVVYGPRDRDMLLYWRWLRRGLLLMLGKSFSCVYVRDAVRAAVLAAEADTASGSVYFITDGRCYTYDDVAEVAARVFGRRPVRLAVPAWLLFTLAWLNERLGNRSIFTTDKARELVCESWACSSERATRELGFAPEFNLEAGLRETVRWAREQGWL